MRINIPLKSTNYDHVAISPRAETTLNRFAGSQEHRLSRLLRHAWSGHSKGFGNRQLEQLLSRWDLFIMPNFNKIAILSPHDLPFVERPVKNGHGNGAAHNIFDSDIKIISGREAGGRSLLHFLENDHPGNVYARIWPIANGCFAFGAHGKRHWINGLGDVDLLYTAILQEKTKGSSRPAKKLYGWTDKYNWGDLDFADIYYTVARETPQGWHIPKRPSTDVSKSRHQEAQAETTRMITYLRKDQGNKQFERDFIIISTRMNHRISFGYKGKDYTIYGFVGHERVKLVLGEELNEATGQLEKIGVFYGYNNGDLLESPLGIYRFARKGKKRWALLHPPEPILAMSNDQQTRMHSKVLTDFMLNDQPEGKEVSRYIRVYRGRGFANFIFNKVAREFYGLTKYAGSKLLCVIRQQGDKKVAYLWPNPNDWANGKDAIRPEGEVVAQKTSGGWQAVHTRNIELIEKQKANREYMKYLMSDNPGRVNYSDWSIHRKKDRNYQAVFKSIKGKKASFYVPAKAIEGLTQLLGVTREVDGKFKVVEFFRSKEDHKQKQKPIRVARVAAKINSSWQPSILNISSKFSEQSAASSESD